MEGIKVGWGLKIKILKVSQKKKFKGWLESA